MDQVKTHAILGNEALNNYAPKKHGTATAESLATFAFDTLTKRIGTVFRTLHAAPSFLSLGPATDGVRGSLIPRDRSIPFGMKKARVVLLTGEGRAEMLSTAGGKLPVVSVTEGEKDYPYEPFGLGIEMTYEDMQAIQAAGDAGASIYDEALRTVRRGMDQLLNNILWYGAANLNLQGVFTAPGIPKETAGTTYVSGSNFETLLRQTNEFIGSLNERSKGVFRTRYLTMGNGLYRFLASAYKEHSDFTLLKILRDTNPDVLFQQAWELDAVTIGGNDLGRCMMASDYGMDYMRHVTSDVIVLPMVTQKAGLEMVMPVLAKTAGIVPVQSLSVAMLTNC